MLQSNVLGFALKLRFLVGALGPAINSSFMNSYLTVRLSLLLGAQSVQTPLTDVSTISTISTMAQQTVREAFAAGYAVQFRILLGFAAV